MNNQVIIAISNTAAVILAIICIGLFIHFIQFLINLLFSKLIGQDATYIFLNKITFIGVIHHELSHALLAFITGAKVVKVKLFKYDEENGSLGQVVFYPRGPFLLRCIQDLFSSIAPTLCGGISIFCLVHFITYNAIWKYIIFGILIFCIFIHMDMSTQDLKIAAKGIPILIITLFAIFYFTNFSLINYAIEYFK